MQQVRNSHHVDAPPEVVWPFVWNAELRPQWEVGVKSVKDVHGPLDQVGGTWTEVRKAPLGRTFEAAVNPERLGWGWAMFAYRSWQRLSAVDRGLTRVLPRGLFYNVLLTGTRPA